MQPDNPLIKVEDIDNAPATLGIPIDFDFVKAYGELRVRFDQISEKLATTEQENDELTRKNNTRQMLDDLIKPLADNSFKFMCFYSSFVGIVLALDGFGFHFSLPEQVMNVLVGSTAVTVIGLVGMVLTGVFVGARSSAK